MRPTTPNQNYYAPLAGPSSPPQTPTTASFQFSKNKRHAMNFSRPMNISTQSGGTITPNGNGPSFYYTPSVHTGPLNLSPRSSSPSNSSVQSSSSSSPPRSLSSSPGLPISESPPRAQRIIVATSANFTLEEFRESDYADFDSDTESIIRPHQYEDAESDRAPSIKLKKSVEIKRTPLNPQIISSFQRLDCKVPEKAFDDDEALYDEEEREKWLEQERIARRKKRRSLSSVQKRTHAQSIGSDTDDEDLKPVLFETANDAGSSARRLRRKVDRTSLIFEDPPPRIDELEEPESCEELVEVEKDEEGQGVDKNLPYYVQDMDVDSSSSEEEAEEEEEEDDDDDEDDDDI